MKTRTDRRGKAGLFILGTVVSAVIVYGVITLLGENDASRIRKVVYKGVLGVESQDIVRCASVVANDYADKYGNSKLMLLKYARDIFKDLREIKVEIKQLQIQPRETEADAQVGFTCYFKKSGEAQVYYDKGVFNLHLKKEGGRWLVDSLEYQGANELLYLQDVA